MRGSARPLCALLLAAAVPALAGPPEGLAPALKPVIGKAARGASRRLNGAYTKDLLRLRVQQDIAAQRERLAAAVARERPQGLRERVLETADEFLAALSPEVDRMHARAEGTEQLRSELKALFARVEAWSFATPASAAQLPALEPTSPDIEGPYYRAGAPFSNDLVPPGGMGRRLRIIGCVKGVDGRPLPGALVDVWQADASGAYDIVEPENAANRGTPFRFRARMNAGADGCYAYRTVMPGQYEVSEGQFRPSHIHYKVSAPGYRGLTTQLYFDGDRYNAADPWFQASNAVHLVNAPGGGEAGRFDVVLTEGR